MMESEWLTCTDPTAILDLVARSTSVRKLRLLTIGVARSVWPYIPAELQPAVEAAERYADGLTDLANITRYRTQKYSHLFSPVVSGWSALPEDERLRIIGLVLALSTCHSDEQLAALSRRVLWTSAIKQLEIPLCPILRDMLGNPSRSITFDPHWRTPTVTTIAQSIYDERAFHCLPALAVAVEKAGCNDTDLLAHCRSAGMHIRGCWVIDLVLDKR